MKNSKKILSLILTCVFLLSACSSNKDEKAVDKLDKEVSSSSNKHFTGELEKNVTIKVVENDTAISKGYFKEILDAFNEKYSDYGIEAVDANVDQNTDLANDGPYGYGPDVLYQANDVIMQYSRDKHILPLPIDEIESMNETPEKAKDAFSLEIDGNKYHVGVPVNVQSPMLFYREDLLPNDWKETWDKNSNDIPDMVEDWSSMYAFSKQRKEEGDYGYMQSLNNVYFSSGFLFSYGAYIFGDGNTNVDKIGFAEGEAEKGAHIIQQLASQMNEESIDDTITTNSYSQLAKGKYFATMTTPDVYSTFISELQNAYEDEGISEEDALEKAKKNLKIVQPPKLPKSGDLEDEGSELIEMKTMGGISGYAISSYTKAPNACLEFIKFATSYENIKRRNELLGIAPTRKDLVNELGTNEKEFIKRLENDEIVLMPSIPELSQVWTPMGTFLSDIVKNTFRDEKDKKYADLNDLKRGLESVDKQIYDAIHTLN